MDGDPRADGLLKGLAANAVALWQGGVFEAASVTLGSELKIALQRANQTGFLVRGLESAERRLGEEEQGLRLLRGEADAGVRISRLVLVTNDGSERFYRNVESLLRRHGLRIAAIRLDVDEHDLGELLFGPERVTRLVMVDHKSAVAEVLVAIAEQWQRESDAD